MQATNGREINLGLCYIAEMMFHNCNLGEKVFWWGFFGLGLLGLVCGFWFLLFFFNIKQKNHHKI